MNNFVLASLGRASLGKVEVLVGVEGTKAFAERELQDTICSGAFKVDG